MLLALVNWLTGSVYGQFSTPTVNGSIGSGEYGSHVDGENQITSGAAIWYMTWDATNLYIAIQNATIDSDHASVVYVDFNPIDTLPDGGTNANGTLLGFNYDNVVYAPTFRADFVVYFKNGYYEFRRADGSNAWSNNVVSGLSYSNSGTGANQTEEIAIPWDSITNNAGKPNKFLWLGLRQRNSGGSLATFQDAPFENQDLGTGSGSPVNEYAFRYFNIANTSNGTSTYPFSRNCYIHPADAAGTENFDDLSVYNFTMNQSGKTIVKNNAKQFKISGLAQIQQGTLNLGTSNNTHNDTIIGNLKIGTSGTLNLSSGTGNIYLNSNFYNYGNFNANGSIVGFNGNSGSQSIVGYFDGANAFSRLQVNNPNGIIAMPNDSLSINDDLILDSGKITIASHQLKLRNTASCTPQAGRANAFVDGIIFWESYNTTSRKFPVGKANDWGQIHITPEQADSRGTQLRQYKIQYFNTSYGNYTLKSQSPQLDHISFVEYWTLEETTGADSINKSCKIKLFWKTNSFIGPSNSKDSLLVCHFNGSDWEWYQQTNTVDWHSVDSGSVESDYTSSFSPITIGSLTASHPLPITLLSFQAKRNSTNSAIINWQTSTETNNAGFELYRSLDAHSYELITSVEASKPNSNQIKVYSYSDNQAPASIAYYQLVQLDLNGNRNTYGPIAIEAASLPSLVVYPNPAFSELKFETNIPLQLINSIIISNVLGQKILSLPIAKENNIDLPSGCYTMQITTTYGQQITRKFNVVR